MYIMDVFFTFSLKNMFSTIYFESKLKTNYRLEFLNSEEGRNRMLSWEIQAVVALPFKTWSHDHKYEFSHVKISDYM